MNNYPLFVTNINTILAGLTGLICLVINHVYYKYKQGTDQIYVTQQNLLSDDQDNQSVTLKQNNYSYLQHIVFITLRNRLCIKYIACICCLYSFVNTLQIYTIQMLTSKDSNLTVLLGEFTIPITMAFSYLFYRKTYNYLHILGSIVVIIGIGLAFSSNMSISTGTQSMIFLTIFLLTCIPQSIAMVVTKYVLSPQSLSIAGQEYNVENVNQQNLGNGLFKSFEFTVLEDFFEIPFNFVFGLIGTLFYNKINVFTDYHDGFLCMILEEGCNGYSLMLLLLFAPVCLITIWIQSLLFQRNDNGVLLYLLIQAICVPLCNVVLSSKYIMGDLSADSTPSIWYGFVIVPIGILIYAAGERKKSHDKKQFVMFDEEPIIN